MLVKKSLFAAACFSLSDNPDAYNCAFVNAKSKKGYEYMPKVVQSHATLWTAHEGSYRACCYDLNDSERDVMLCQQKILDQDFQHGRFKFNDGKYYCCTFPTDEEGNQVTEMFFLKNIISESYFFFGTKRDKRSEGRFKGMLC